MEGKEEFDWKEKLIQAYEKVNLEQVVMLFHDLFFENPRRLNVKIYSHKHHSEQEKIKE